MCCVSWLHIITMFSCLYVHLCIPLIHVLISNDWVCDTQRREWVCSISLQLTSLRENHQNMRTQRLRCSRRVTSSLPYRPPFRHLGVVQLTACPKNDFMGGAVTHQMPNQQARAQRVSWESWSFGLRHIADIPHAGNNFRKYYIKIYLEAV